MNISGVLVSARPEKIDQVKQALEKLDGVEVHLQTDDGQLIVTVEEMRGADSMLAIHRTDGIIAASLVYHNFESNEDDEIETEIAVCAQENLVA